MPNFPTQQQKIEAFQSSKTSTDLFDAGWNACLDEVVRVMRLWNFEEGDVPVEWGPISEDVSKVARALEVQLPIKSSPLEAYPGQSKGLTEAESYGKFVHQRIGHHRPKPPVDEQMCGKCGEPRRLHRGIGEPCP